MWTLRRIACLPFLVLAIVLWLMELPINALGLLCLRTIEQLAKHPQISEMMRRMFLLRDIRCPRCGTSDVKTIDPDND